MHNHIIERLRSAAMGLGKYNFPITAPILSDAANEIERLTEELAEYTTLQQYAATLGQETYLQLHARNERYKAALEKISSKNLYPEQYREIAASALNTE